MYLRLSLTERCNLRCAYCAPAGCARPRGSAELSDDEVLALVAQIHRAAGLSKVRLTGGEPLLRRGAVELLGRLRALLPEATLALTTNGTLLERHAAELSRYGLDALNISLDTPDPEEFFRLTGGGDLARVARGVAAARQALQLSKFKLNTVLLRSRNLHRLAELVRLARRWGCEPRFIELMPFGAGAPLFLEEYVSADEALSHLSAAFPLLSPPADGAGSGAARRLRLEVDGEPLSVGLISAVSHPFCSRCDRLRLDARGRLFSCLRSTRGEDLALLLRRGEEEELWRRVRALVAGKRLPAEFWPARSMASIGG